MDSDVCLLKVARGQNDTPSGRVSLCGVIITAMGEKKAFFITCIALVLSHSSVRPDSTRGIIALGVAKLSLSFLSGRSLVYYTPVMTQAAAGFDQDIQAAAGSF